jgi:predicted dehydrogenase
MKGKIRVGLIGAGAIGQAHAQTVAASDRAVLAAVCDPALDRARACATTDSAIYESVDDMLAGTRIDAAIVAAPPNVHRELAELLAANGVHVLCEKPFATTVKDARAMLRASRRSGTILTMAAKFRFVDDVRQTRAAIDSGAIGDLMLLENTFTTALPMAERWNSDPNVSGGGVIIDNGTHSVDLFRYLAGPLQTVRAVEIERYQRLAVEDTAQLVARCATGAVAISDLSWTIDKRQPFYLRAHGSHGTVEIGWRESRIRTSTDADWRKFGDGYSKIAAFAGVFANFVAAIAGEEPVELSGADAIASVGAIEAAYRTMAKPGWAEVAA